MTYSEFLSSCSLTDDDCLVADSPYIDYGYLSARLSKDLLDSKIPHMRPVGLNVGNANDENTFIDRLGVINMSYYDLMVAVRDVVFTTAGDFESDARVKNALARYYRGYEFKGGIAVLGEPNVTTGDDSIVDNGTSNKCKFLIDGLPIVQGVEHSYAVYILYLSGTGYQSANEMSSVLRYCKYKPIITDFSLNRYVLVDTRLPEDGIKLHFKCDLNKDGLLSILHEYGSSLEGM